MNAHIPPVLCASASVWYSSVVLPDDSGPKTSTMRPRGMPPTPSARSSDRAPVGIAATRTAASSSPILMIEPLPKARSIWPSAPFSAASRALAAFSCSFSSLSIWLFSSKSGSKGSVRSGSDALKTRSLRLCDFSVTSELKARRHGWVRPRDSANKPDDALDDEQGADRGESSHGEAMCVRADPRLGAIDRMRCPIWSDQESSERDLEQPQHHQVEADYHEHGDRGRVVQLVELIEAGEVGGAREREQRPDHEGRARRSLAQLALPPRRTLVRLGLFTCAAALREAFLAPGVEDEGASQGDRSQPDVDGWAQGAPRRVGRARVRKREDDHEPERDARDVRAEQIARHHLGRAREQQHDRRHRDQRRVQRGGERQKDYLAHWAQRCR